MKWVRPIIGVMAMAGVVYGFVVGKIDAPTYVIIAGGAIAWWFKSRDQENRQG